MFNDEEENVSRNYLMILEDRLSSKSIGEYQNEPLSGGSPATTTFGNAIPPTSSSSSTSSISISNTIITTTNTTSSAPTKYRPGDKLIIKAKVYILEILEVHSQ